VVAILAAHAVHERTDVDIAEYLEQVFGPIGVAGAAGQLG
jgi:hypothetical protein